MRTPARMIWALALAGSLSACGAQADLKPRAGHSLPIAPLGRADKPSAAELLKTQVQARPGRNIELETKSQLRADDAFDLPPKD